MTPYPVEVTGTSMVVDWRERRLPPGCATSYWLTCRHRSGSAREVGEEARAPDSRAVGQKFQRHKPVWLRPEIMIRFSALPMARLLLV
jgi:hypothetical protein